MAIKHWLDERFSFRRRLGFRLGALLSLAILPLGLISLLQNLNLSSEAERSAEIAILGRTASAAAGERALLQSALGSADALGPAVLEAIEAPDRCSGLMYNFIERSAAYVFAGFIPMNGLSACNSATSPGKFLDFRMADAYNSFVREPGTLVTSVGSVPGWDSGAVLVMQPLYRDRDLLGYVALALTHELLRSTHAINFGTEGARIVTFNHRGDILTADTDLAGPAADLLPQGQELIALLSRSESAFRAKSNGGESRIFSVVPVVPGLVYALGSWSPKSAQIGLFQVSRLGAVFIPIALWLATLGVAYYAVFRLVLRHIGVLRGQMRRFAIGNRSAPPPVLSGAPTEITDVSQTFHNMARILIRDEAALEASLTEKTVLLKELHHRVKNNLQLIASIINMQSRVIKDDDAKHVLHSVQDRVSALATIYKNLYQAEHLDAVEADQLLGDIFNKMENISAETHVNLQMTIDLQPITLLPDQAVPLSLLATEAFTNALKYVGQPDDEGLPWVHVKMTRLGADRAELEISNSLGQTGEFNEGTGLGSQLIEAFSIQLDGDFVSEVVGNVYVMKLGFKIEQPTPRSDSVLGGIVLTSAARNGVRH